MSVSPSRASSSLSEGGRSTSPSLPACTDDPVCSSVEDAHGWMQDRIEMLLGGNTESHGAVVVSDDVPMWLLDALCDGRPGSTTLVLTTRIDEWAEFVKDETIVITCGMRAVKRGLILRHDSHLHLTCISYFVSGATFVVADLALLSDPNRLHLHGVPFHPKIAGYPPHPVFSKSYNRYLASEPDHALAFDTVQYSAVVTDLTRPVTQTQFSLIALLAKRAPLSLVWVETLPLRLMKAASVLIGYSEMEAFSEGLFGGEHDDDPEEETLMQFVEDHACICGPALGRRVLGGPVKKK